MSKAGTASHGSGLALVTGASRGIGRAVALALAADGYEIAVHYGTNPDAAQETISLIEAAGGTAFAVAADLQKLAGVEAIAEALGDRPIHVLVNNAGRQLADGPMAEEATFDALIAVNVKAAYFLIQKLTPQIVDGGRIINISSGTSTIGFPDKMVYAMAKAAMNAMTMSLAKALGPRGITVNAVLPGLIETDMNPWVRNPEAAARVANIAVLQRVGQPDDIADVVAFLASPAARWITGELLHASGGGQLGR